VGIVRVGIVLLAVVLFVPVTVARAQPGMVEPTLEPKPRERTYGVGYARGAGLGNYGASVAMTAGERLVPQVLVFAFNSDGQTGFAIAPTIQLSFVDNRHSSPFIAAGLQIHRLWFGDDAAGGLGGFANLGWELRWEPIAIQLGIGLNIKETIVATDGVVRMSQAPVFGLHWDAGIRYWF
jgi:hypothetical protein